MNRVRMLVYFGVTPYIVFDGGMLPSKTMTEEARAARREESKKAGLRLYHTGRVSQAHQELQKAIDVTPYMARVVIEELKKLKVQYVVAPYEADPQLVYLEKQGIINGIISEDSDMLVFGAKRLISKLDQHGDGIELNRGDFTACRDISLIGWTDENFRHMCILSGCDYLANIPGMGLKTAYRHIRTCKSAERAIKMVRFDGKSRVPASYLEDFKRAELTFLHQRVFCPTSQKLVTLTPLPVNVNGEDMLFIGEDVSPEEAIAVACGDLDPLTKEPIVVRPAYPERHRMVVDARQTLPSATEKRPTPRITSFFTPKRTPLGQLDPNSLTPSPSQQQVLEHNSNRSWAASPMPTPPNSARSLPSSFSTPRPQRAPGGRQHTSAQRESFPARAATLPRLQPAKRQRLCSDADAGDRVEETTEKKSRFFAASDTGKGVSLSGQVKQARKSKLPIFSDDSVEDIMSQLPDSQCVSSIPDSPAFSEENTPSRWRMGNVGQSSTEGTGNQKSQECSSVTIESTPPDPSDHSTTPTDPSPGSDTDLATFNHPSLNLKTQYGHRGSVSGCSREESQFKVTAIQPANSLKRPAPLEECHPPAIIHRKTPLQRLGQAALSRSKSLNTLGKQESREAGKDEPGYDSDCTTSLSLQAKGSEDLIVPDSQDEDEGEDEDEDELVEPKPKVFDVTRYMFAPV